MNDKYSSAKREQYGQRLAAQLCDQHFGPAPTATLDGPAVLRFTPIRQVNLFVVQQLLAQWTGEMARLRSPYFDFEAPDVRQALTQFMNTLSRRIKLGRAAFEPLLARAIGDTLGVATNPQQAFEQKLLGTQPTTTAEQLRDALRYLDLDKALFQGFIDTLTPGTALERDFVLNRFRLYQEANYKAHTPLEKVVEEFSQLLPLSVGDLQDQAPAAEATKAAEAAPAVPVAVAAPPAAPEAVAPPVASAPEPTPLPTFVAPAAPAPAPVAAPPAEPEPIRRPLAEAAAPAGVPLYEKLKAEQPASAPLSETLRGERPSTTLAEKSAPKVESLREAISINQRFSFINELFNGENMEYHTAIQHLDTLPNADVAKRYVTEDLAQKYGWVRKEEHVNKLLKLLDRKFA
ncbi:hypothetical protein [Hymenobacter chitinivorans]|uniref:Uncharacterized protein n=1 Tax=Hymenobacter chitinivorans DSM 11115 TaxID=1121954 RepID=A0A2M9APZ9_9BACT|nr:hypothetical protein [Hymenobacter chitinivorans]PJJ47776.1 hypothetical protein CLV45_4914 [Hymenobacter chitinivorans DSM 11115]